MVQPKWNGIVPFPTRSDCAQENVGDPVSAVLIHGLEGDFACGGLTKVDVIAGRWRIARCLPAAVDNTVPELMGEARKAPGESVVAALSPFIINHNYRVRLAIDRRGERLTCDSTREAISGERVCVVSWRALALHRRHDIVRENDSCGESADATLAQQRQHACVKHDTERLKAFRQVGRHDARLGLHNDLVPPACQSLIHREAPCCLPADPIPLRACARLSRQ